jgi:hypothetical protein
MSFFLLDSRFTSVQHSRIRLVLARQFGPICERFSAHGAGVCQGKAPAPSKLLLTPSICAASLMPVLRAGACRLKVGGSQPFEIRRLPKSKAASASYPTGEGRGHHC